ncbi:unnamed protein product [Malus baccata var. baccata]
MGNCASEPKTKGDDAAAVPAPEPRKESVQAEEVNAEQLQEENKAEQNTDGGHNKQPSLGALLKEEEEKRAEVAAKLEEEKIAEVAEKLEEEKIAEVAAKIEEAEEKPKTTEKNEETAVELEKSPQAAAPAAVTQEDKKSDIEEKKAEEVKETKPEETTTTKTEETKETKPEVKDQI